VYRARRRERIARDRDQALRWGHIPSGLEAAAIARGEQLLEELRPTAA
jgi:hypothetical protein